MKPIVGLTGGIGSGKTKASSFFSEFSVPVVDADKIAKQVVLPGTKGFEQVVDVFGDGYVLEGQLDRDKLGKLVFEKPEARKKINQILHPLIAEESQKEFQRYSNGDVPFILYEAALIVENGIQAMFNALILVAVSKDTQLKRLMSRGEITEKEAQNRIQSQLPLSAKLPFADFILDNEQDELYLKQQVQKIFPQILQRLGSKEASTSKSLNLQSS